MFGSSFGECFCRRRTQSERCFCCCCYCFEISDEMVHSAAFTLRWLGFALPNWMRKHCLQFLFFCSSFASSRQHDEQNVLDVRWLWIARATGTWSNTMIEYLHTREFRISRWENTLELHNARAYCVHHSNIIVIIIIIPRRCKGNEFEKNISSFNLTIDFNNEKLSKKDHKKKICHHGKRDRYRSVFWCCRVKRTTEHCARLI